MQTMQNTNLALYFGENHSAGNRLGEVIRGVVRRGSIRVYRTVDDLCRGFRQPCRVIDPLVLFPADRSDLSHLVRMGRLFMNHRIVLILPDRTGNTIAGGHTLFPRYVTFSGGDFSDVVAVLEKMLRKEGAEAPPNIASDIANDVGAPPIMNREYS